MEEVVLKGKTLLVVDDEVDLRDIMASELEFMGAKVVQAGNVLSAKESLKNNKIDLIVSDIRMPGGTGIDLLEHVKALDPSYPPVILITGFADIAPEDAYNKGAEALLNKPFKLEDLIQMVERNTFPLDERFSNSDIQGNQELNVNFDETLEESIASKKFLIGRGGVALVLSTLRKKIESTDLLNFSFHFKDHHFKGTGICRWLKVTEGQRAVMGLEFISVDADTLKFLREHWRQGHKIPFIPVP